MISALIALVGAFFQQGSVYDSTVQVCLDRAAIYHAIDQVDEMGLLSECSIIVQADRNNFNSYLIGMEVPEGDGLVLVPLVEGTKFGPKRLISVGQFESELGRTKRLDDRFWQVAKAGIRATNAAAQAVRITFIRVDGPFDQALDIFLSVDNIPGSSYLVVCRGPNAMRKVAFCLGSAPVAPKRITP